MDLSGVPTRLRHLAGDFGGDSPGVMIETPQQVSVDDLTMLGSAGFELHIQADGPEPFDLRPIEGALRSFRSLFLAGTAPQPYRGWLALESCAQLELLEIARDPFEEVNWTALRALTRTSVRGRHTVGLLSSPRLERLSIFTRLKKDVEVVGPVRELSVLTPTATDIEFLAQPSKLEGLLVNGSRIFDAASLRNASNLKLVRFVGCKKLLNLSTLLELSSLSTVEMFGVKDASGADSLRSLRSEHVLVEDNFLFDENFRASVGDKVGWSIGSFQSRKSYGMRAPANSNGDVSRDRFYSLLDASRVPEGVNVDRLALALGALDNATLDTFSRQMERELAVLDSMEVHDVAVESWGEMSDDSFLDFRAFLIGLGCDVVDAVVRQPKKMRNFVKSQSPFDERLMYVVDQELERRELSN